MIDVLNLALPYFGLIFIGFACGKLKQIPDTALAWMNFFIVYVALAGAVLPDPCPDAARAARPARLHFRHHVGDVLGLCGFVRDRHGDPAGQHRGIDHRRLAGGYGNIGYMGPGLALATLGPQAAVPVALIFCFDTLLLFSLVPFLMALASPSQKSTGAVAAEVVKRIALIRW